MKFVNPIPFVRDIEISKNFYARVLGISILEDHGDFVTFKDGFAIHSGAVLFQTVFGTDDDTASAYGRANLVLYFEDDHLDRTFAEISKHVELIHPIRREPWGQRVFRFFDPDRHVVEIGEPQ
ncbi:VOC family protein [Gymnodinialimonas sp. 2305UL16-5]|uniref:VOC family protein n=1 Tax=Gymnodinialimonas mytili TaxID=3126503 RepID=UPI0030B013C9